MEGQCRCRRCRQGQCGEGPQFANSFLDVFDQEDLLDHKSQGSSGRIAVGIFRRWSHGQNRGSLLFASPSQGLSTGFPRDAFHASNLGVPARFPLAGPMLGVATWLTLLW